MIKKLQLVALGWVVFQGVGLVAMDKNALKKEIVVKVAVPCVREGKKVFPDSVPRYVWLERLDWSSELKKNPHLVWMPI